METSFHRSNALTLPSTLPTYISQCGFACNRIEERELGGMGIPCSGAGILRSRSLKPPIVFKIERVEESRS